MVLTEHMLSIFQQANPDSFIKGWLQDSQEKQDKPKEVLSKTPSGKMPFHSFSENSPTPPSEMCQVFQGARILHSVQVLGPGPWLTRSHSLSAGGHSIDWSSQPGATAVEEAPGCLLMYVKWSNTNP